MRLWSLHPKYLDARGLVALWREGLLARAVLRGKTRGYRKHPQLERFRKQRSPLGCIAAYLLAVRREALRRGYAFDAAGLRRTPVRTRLTVTRGQLDFEWRHLLAKLKRRDPGRYARLKAVQSPPAPHPLLRIVPGWVEPWEKGKPPATRQY